MPLALPPHAYVVEYRVLDRCAPPACVIRTSAALGAATPFDSAGKAAGYAHVGTAENEAYAKRAGKIAPGAEVVVELPASDAASDLDVYFATGDLAAGGSWSASIETSASAPIAASGVSTVWKPASTEPELAHEDAQWTHRRVPLPSRRDHAITLRIRNVGSSDLLIGTPEIMHREERAPRQAFFVFTDAVPGQLQRQMFDGSGDPETAWVGPWVHANGTVFSRLLSPGFLTGGFVRRFFQGQYFDFSGEPSLTGQGFDETPPDGSPSLVSRLEGQGFVTQAIAANYYLFPDNTLTQFDSGYNTDATEELQMHPPALARRFDRFLEEHPDDDTFVVVWFCNTHEPFVSTKEVAPPLRYIDTGKDDANGVVVDIWKNYLEAIASFGKMHASALTRSPNAHRVWFLSADHGRTFSSEWRTHPWRDGDRSFGGDHYHSFMGSNQDTQIAGALVTEGGAPAPGVEDGVATSFVAWRKVETELGVDLKLPRTSSFDDPQVSPDAAARFPDNVFAASGDGGAFTARSDDWSYRLHVARHDVRDIWQPGASEAQMLAGGYPRSGALVNEQLYAVSSDPGEAHNVATEHLATTLDLRRRVVDWVAEYAEEPDHAKYRTTLELGAVRDLVLDAPRPFRLSIDGGPWRLITERHVAVSAVRLDLEDEGVNLGVLDVSGLAGLTLRCGATGMPLAIASPDGLTRLNFPLMRTNCVEDAETRALAPTASDVIVTAVLRSKKTMVAAKSTGALAELQSALRRWGYVRDRDTK